MSQEGLFVGNVQPVQLEDEIQRSYLDYSMSVIVGRALPDVRDGLKPVHKRILWAMLEAGYRHDRPHRKCAAVIGDVLKKYHPHGDQSVYDALVRMAQDWSLRYPLVDGHGNFGSVDGDPAAAYRYTEARLAPMAMELLRDIDSETVDFVPNFDGYEQQPTVLPSRFPNLLVNGAGGIAVGMATNIPPHNLGEVIDGVIWIIENTLMGAGESKDSPLPVYTREEKLKNLIRLIPGPDFPTGGMIVGKRGIHEAALTGRGSIQVRASPRSRAGPEDVGRGRYGMGRAGACRNGGPRAAATAGGAPVPGAAHGDVGGREPGRRPPGRRSTLSADEADPNGGQ